MRKRRRLGKAGIFLAAVLIGVIALRFALSFWGEEVPCEYIFKESFSLFGKEFSFAVYRFKAGIPFFGITLSLSEMLLGTVKFLPVFPIISGESILVNFDWGEAGFLTAAAILLIGILCRGKPQTEEIENVLEDTEEVEAEKEDKSLCPKCGKKIFGDNLYCENCGAKIAE